MPEERSSAYPDMLWSGVFSSCDTFAVNSRRIFSAVSRSVISIMIIAVPQTRPSLITGLTRK